MARNRNKLRDIANWSNAWTFDRVQNMIELLAVNSFIYENAPDTFNPYFFERKLFYDGFAWLFKDGDMILGLGGSRKDYDVYGWPTSGKAIGFHGYNFNVTPDNGVCCYDLSKRGLSTYGLLMDYIPRLTDLYRTMDVNIHAQKTPVIVVTDKENELTVRNAVDQIDSNMSVIVGVEGILDMKQFDVLNTNAPYVVDKLQIQSHQYWNDIFTILGIENGDKDKKERMVVDEVNSNTQPIEIYRNARLQPRERMLERFNKLAGTNIQVRFNSEILSSITNADEYYISGQPERSKGGSDDVPSKDE